jgi:CheY-like chemotaxis protein
MGYKPDLAANGTQALATLDRQPYDLIFMDVQMPEMDGLEATRHIRERQKDRAKFPNYKSPIVIIAMTANAMQGDREKCLAAGMDDYLAKPVRPEEVRKLVERWGMMINASGSAEPVETPTASPTGTRSETENEPVVDMARLLDLTDGTTESLNELVTLYLTQTSGQLDQLAAAARANQAKDVRRVAHSCAGASATCGINRLVPILRELERQGDEGKLTNAVELCQKAADEFARVRTSLEAHLAKQQSVVTAKT